MNTTLSPRTAGRKLHASLARGFLDALANYAGSTRAHEHVANRPDLADALLRDAQLARVSDIHLEPRGGETRVRWRIDGSVQDVAVLSVEEGKWLLNQFKALAGIDPVARFTPQDSHARFTAEGLGVDLRLAITPCHRGEALSVRLLDPRRLEHAVDDLGLTPGNLAQLEDWLENVNGMFLAVGPTGAGKTTTIYALLHELKFADRVVISLEDPVEYEIAGITQVQLDEKHHLTFAEGVKAMLRLDPDMLMMGEIRDAASAHAAVGAAITGRVLLSTVHAKDAAATVTALRNWGLADHEIAESLSVVVAQRLVRKLCPACRKPGTPTPGEQSWLRALHLAVPDEVWCPEGCEACHGFGYSGRTGIFEFWRLDESDYRLLLAHADEHTLRRHLSQRRHATFIEDALAKIIDGTTTLAELRRASSGAVPPPPAAPPAGPESTTSRLPGAITS